MFRPKNLMKETYQAWCEEEDGRIVATTLATLEGIQEQLAKVLLSRSARLMYQIEADTLEEAHAVHHLKMGWEPYRPMGKAQKCPNGCGSMYYPEGSGDCPICGNIC